VCLMADHVDHTVENAAPLRKGRRERLEEHHA
jgi:hypothetical protein